MILVPDDAPPLVFLGPSAPASDVRSLLPQAEIRPPVRRGDLYQARLLRYSVFIVIDGVFAQRESIPPREVVDVLRDGAAVIGASSMGALRATDCHPAGAIGIGSVYRLFRTGAINSEDEVALVFDADNPYPAVTESLVGMRVALRRAVRGGVLAHQSARAIVDVARSMPYTERTWANVIDQADPGLGAALTDTLRSGIDIKRSDACTAFRRVAHLRGRDASWFSRPRRDRGTFGGMGAARERPADGLLGRSRSEIEPGFVLWMLLSGRANRFLEDEPPALDRLATLDLSLAGDWIGKLDDLDWAVFGDGAESVKGTANRLNDRLAATGRFDAEHYRHAAIAEGVRHAIATGIAAGNRDIAAVERDLSDAHNLAGPEAIEQLLPAGTVRRIQELKLWWARAKACRRAAIGI